MVKCGDCWPHSMSLLTWFFGVQPENEEEKDELETVETLCERIKSCTLLDEKRHALAELRTLSENCKLAVGSRALDIVFDVLKSYGHDRDLIVLSLDIIANIINCKISVSSDNPTRLHTLDSELSEQFCEILLKTPKNIQILIETLDNTNYQIRWAVLKIFITISKLQLEKFQSVLNNVHFGLTRITEFLNEPREMIRNDCILLLMRITLHDKNTQKILAFENVFQKLFSIIDGEGGIDGGMIAQDCLITIRNLLTSNFSNQKYFLELGLFAQLRKLLVNDENQLIIIEPISSFQVNNMIEVFKVIRTFLDPIVSPQSLNFFQSAMNEFGIFKIIFNFFPPSKLPEHLITEACLTIAEIIRSNRNNQDLFSFLMNERHPNQEAVFSLLISLICPTLSLSIKRSLLYIFDCFVHSNLPLCQKLVQALDNSDNTPDSPELGRALCAGFFDHDNFFCYISCSCLLDVIFSFPQGRKQLLKVHFVVDDSTQVARPVSLLERCYILIKFPNISLSAKSSLLSLLIALIYDCSEVLEEFLKLEGAQAFPVSNLLDHSTNYDTAIRGLLATMLVVYLTFASSPIRSQIFKNLSLHMDLSHIKNTISAFIQTPQFVASSNSPRTSLCSDIHYNFEFTSIVKKSELLATELIESDISSHTNTSQITSQAFAEKDQEIEKLKNDCLLLQSKVDSLQKIIDESKLREATLIEFKISHEELNNDFKKLLYDHQQLLNTLEQQEIVIKNLTFQLQSQSTYYQIQAPFEYSSHHQNFFPSYPPSDNQLHPQDPSLFTYFDSSHNPNQHSCEFPQNHNS